MRLAIDTWQSAIDWSEAEAAPKLKVQFVATFVAELAFDRLSVFLNHYEAVLQSW